MAKYTVTRKCGHEEMVILGGSSEGRRRELDRLGSLPCMDCKRAAELAAAERAAAAAGLPALTGSEKQVAWAMRIRAQMLNKISQNREEYARFWDKHYADRCSLDQAVARLVSKTSAAWWIDHRDHNPVNLARDVVFGMR